MDPKFVCSTQVLYVRPTLLSIFMLASFAAGLQQNLGRATTSIEQSIAMSASWGYSNVFWENGREHLYKSGSSPVPATMHEQGLSSNKTYGGEIEALMAFKHALSESSRGTLDSWNSSDGSPCDWKGIKCSQQLGRVIAIDLAGMGLAGNLSPLLGRLQYLQSLDLSHNSLVGELPPSLVNCTALAYLALNDNRFSGQIPYQIGDLSYLQLLNLSTNFYLRGPIPPSLGNSSLLRLLRLDYTLVRGEIPDALGRLKHLQILNLTCTFNNGTIPKTLGNCSALNLISLGNLYNVNSGDDNIILPPTNIPLGFSYSTKLSGTLPEELGQLKRLQGLAIGGTDISGPFPSWIANLTSLTGLGLEMSQFNGEIPDFLGHLPLEILGLALSHFSGVIPSSLSNCSNLWFLDLRGLYLKSTIPPEFGQLKRLAVLSLYEVDLQGKIPSSLSNCSSLQMLLLGRNVDVAFHDPGIMETQPLPSWVGSLVKLIILTLQSIHLVGEIPPGIGKLSHLEFLYLRGNPLGGSIPKSLKNCTRLQLLDISGNQLTGTIPLELWDLVQLQALYISRNKLTGSLSNGITNLTSLRNFEAYRNFLNNTIPSRLSELSGLSSVDLGDNYFNGYIPDIIGNLSALQLLNISHNKLTGSIPTSMGNLTDLQLLDLSENSLHGSIPANLMSCHQLVELYLHRNGLVQNIPVEIGQLRNLTHLYLNDNRLSGLLPQSLGLCSSLQDIDLSYNAFYGVLPEEIFANLSISFTSLNLSSNLFFGALPNSLGLLTGVTTLDVSNNSFSGIIPLNLRDCTSLESLDLSVNKFTGFIPANLGKLQNLALLNLSYNDLQGPLPDSGGIFSSKNLSASWFSGNPRLCGNILPQKCSAHDSSGQEPRCKGLSCRSVKTVVIIFCSIFGLVGAGIGMGLAHRFLRAHARGESVNSGDWHLQGLNDVSLTEQDLIEIIEEPTNLVSVGACGSVYKGDLSNSSGRTVAVKVFKQRLNHSIDTADDGGQSYKQAAYMYTEAHALSQLKHRNVLRVLGMLSTPRITALVLEFMPMGSLHDQLHKVEECSLEWETRMDIAVGVAQGLVYLHEEIQVPVIHRDVKPSNILLDADMIPKLGDFGISRFVNPTGMCGEVTTAQLRGTIGYIPPEYAGSTKVSTAGDVYSYGVTLLELITRKRPITHKSDHGHGLDSGLYSAQNPLVVWVYKVSRDSSPLAMMDSMLLAVNHSGMVRQIEQMKLFVQIGLLCTQDNPRFRPRMCDVLNMLTHIQRLGHDASNIPTLEDLINNSA